MYLRFNWPWDLSEGPKGTFGCTQRVPSVTYEWSQVERAHIFVTSLMNDPKCSTWLACPEKIMLISWRTTCLSSILRRPFLTAQTEFGTSREFLIVDDFSSDFKRRQTSLTVDVTFWSKFNERKPGNLKIKTLNVIGQSGGLFAIFKMSYVNELSII